MAKVFHYTSNEGAIRIIQSQCLHATHFEYLNDSRELLTSNSIMQPIISNFIKIRYNHLVDMKVFKPGIDVKHGADFFDREAERIITKAMTVGTRLAPPFLLSFCRHSSGDEEWQHGLLSQWRGYGSGGGCALEFEEDDLIGLIEKEKSRFAYGILEKGDAIYSEYYRHLDEVMIIDVVNNLLDSIAEIKDPNDPPNIDYLHHAIFGVGSMFKHAAFKEEEEVRITACPVRINSKSPDYGKPGKPIEMRYRSGMPIPYIKLFDFDSPLPITRVLIGPQKEQGRVAKALQFVLEDQDISVPIDISGISYLP